MEKFEKIDKKNIEDIAALTPMQEGLLFHYLREPGGEIYSEQLYLDIAGEIDIDLFGKAWDIVVASNEILRTIFRWEDVNHPVQLVLKEQKLDLEYYDLSGSENNLDQQAADEIKIRGRTKPFDLHRTPFRVVLFKIGQARFEMWVGNHHILYDGWSNGIILEEFFNAYNALIQGRNPIIPRKSKYKEFVQYIQGQNKKSQEDFWRNYLSGFSVKTGLPPRLKEARKTNAAAQQTVSFSKEDAERLGNFTREYRITPASFWYTVWAILLQKYNNTEDVLFGTTVSGRNVKINGIENTVGLFINTIPLRIRGKSRETLLTLLRAVRQNLEKREEFENTSLAEIVGWSETVPGEALFDSIAAIENYPMHRALSRTGMLSLRSYKIEESTHYDITIGISQLDHIDITFGYHNKFFDEETIERLSRHFMLIARQMMENPGKTIGEVELLTEEERTKILYEFNDTDAEYPRDKTIHRQFQEQVARKPDGLALLYGEERLTYSQLNRKANRIARLLREKGVGPDRIVCLMLERSIEMMVGIFAVLKAGGAYLPMEVGQPVQRTLHILRDSAAGTLLTRKQYPHDLEGYLEMIDLEKEIIEENGDIELPGANRPDALAYVIYTSGSTGKPKGVMIQQGSLVNRLHWMQKKYPLFEGDILLQKTPYVFDVSVWEIFWWSIVGAGLCLLPPGDEKLPGAVAAAVEKNRVTVIHFIPSMLSLFLDHIESGGKTKHIACLRRIFASGEALSLSLANWFDRLLYRENSTKLTNLYGPTEATVDVSYFDCSTGRVFDRIPIGKPIDNTVLVVAAGDRLQPVGIPGELYIGGVALARGYLNQPELTAERFKDNRLCGSYKAYIFYKTGDLVRWLSDGNIEFLGRKDHQVKIRGQRIELGEIEAVLSSHHAVENCAVVVKESANDLTLIAAYMVLREKIPTTKLKQYLTGRLPAYMIPHYFIPLDRMPLTGNGKINRRALPDPVDSSLCPGAPFVPASNDVEQKTARVWAQVLGRERISIHDNFFDLGGNSLSLIRLTGKLEKTFNKSIPVTAMFRYPTIEAFAKYLLEGEGENTDGAIAGVRQGNGGTTGYKVAVIGMAGRFPGAGNIDEFWENLKQGVESITFFSTGELLEAGIDERLLNDDTYIRAKGVLEGTNFFDSSFFDYTPAEAEIMDPQFRILHECCWEALENSGCDPSTYKGAIGIYVGSSANFHWLEYLSRHKIDYFGEFGTMLLNEKDFLGSRVSYKLDLKGPVIIMQTACSTSLAAVDAACQGLSTGKCSMALAGGVSVSYPEKSGYLYREGMVFSPDGHCRAFDAKAKGLSPGNGVGIVLLKPLPQALADRDTVHAVILGSALNNDGARKVGYTAPSIEGQAEVILKALENAGVDPGTVGYIETHGTGTPLGDPIEVEALKLAFQTGEKQACPIGSVKTNIGHLDAAAGIAGFIKTVLALENKLIPASLNFATPNSAIDFESTPFYVNTRLSPWKNKDNPLRAGVSSFGIGGVNVHVILEEAPGGREQGEACSKQKLDISRSQLILLSAKNSAALERMTRNLAEHFKRHPGINLADAAYTLSVGRKAFKYRETLVCSETKDAVTILSGGETGKLRISRAGDKKKNIVFMFPGLGSQYPDMGLQLYREFPLFRESLDRCFQILDGLTDWNVKQALYPALGGNPAPGAALNINHFAIAQAVVFTFEYALAKLVMSWGIQPQAMIGYSLGEYAAACLSGVFTLEDALKLIVSRGKLIQTLPAGVMLSVPLEAHALTPLLNDDLSLSIINGPSCIVSGSREAVAAFEKQMREKRFMCMPVPNSYALHSKEMEPILVEFGKMASGLTLRKPQIPYISNVTGDWIKPGEAVLPGYWARHLRETVRFSEGMEKLTAAGNFLLLEVGPGRDLTVLTSHYAREKNDANILNLVRSPHAEVPDVHFLQERIACMWRIGIDIDWGRYYSGQDHFRIPLPTYPFEKRQFPAYRPLKSGDDEMLAKTLTGKKPDIGDWFYIPLWKESPLKSPGVEKNSTPLNILVFIDESSLGQCLVRRLKQAGGKIVTVRQGCEFHQESKFCYIIDSQKEDHYEFLLKDAFGGADFTEHLTIVYFWSMVPPTGWPEEMPWSQCIYKLAHLARAIGKQAGGRKISIMAVTDRSQAVLGDEVQNPEAATVIGPVRVIPLEYPDTRCCAIDIVFPGPDDNKEEVITSQLMAELYAGLPDPVVALRGSHRWLQLFEPTRLEKTGRPSPILKDNGIYLITGGLGALGLAAARCLAAKVKARLILTGRSSFPPSSQWDHWLTSHNTRDIICVKIRELQDLEKRGAEIMVFQADITDSGQMEKVVAAARERWGNINGVVHLAGQLDRGLIRRRGIDTLDKGLAARVRGAFVLEAILKDPELDFFILGSSVNAVVPVIGGLGNVAAFNFLDAFAPYLRTKRGTFTMSINWDGWKDSGMAVETVRQMGGDPAIFLKDGISAAEGIEAFTRILENPIPRVAVFTRDLQQVIRDSGIYGTSDYIENLSGEKSSDGLFQRPDLMTPYVPPQNNIQGILADIWQKFIGLQTVGIHDDFFELGGDSLKAITLAHKIHKELGVEVPPVEFFNNPTIEKLSGYVEKSKTNTFFSIPPAEEKESYALSSGQKRLYILHRLDSASLAYNEYQFLLLEGELDRQRFEEAFRLLIHRQESLRTSIQLVGNEPVQKIHDKVEFQLEYFQTAEEKAKELVDRFVRPFCLEKAPLLRGALVRIGEAKHLLIIDMHHIITDGISHDIFTRDFVAFYSGQNPPGLNIRYRDFSEWHNRLLQSERIKEQENYWLRQFKDEIPVLAMPWDFPRTRGSRFYGDQVAASLDQDMERSVRTLARETDTTLYMIFLAVYNILLSKYTMQEDIVVGSTISGRTHADLQNLVGMFVNMVAMRNQPRRDKTFSEFLLEVKENALNAYMNQDYHIDLLVKKLKVRREPGRNPLFDAVFALQDNKARGALVVENLKISSYDLRRKITKFDLALRAVETKDTIIMELEYSPELLKYITAQKFLERYLDILGQIVKNKDIKLQDIDMSRGLLSADTRKFESQQGEFEF